jgi:hypothetical protein
MMQKRSTTRQYFCTTATYQPELKGLKMNCKLVIVEKSQHLERKQNEMVKR